MQRSVVERNDSLGIVELTINRPEKLNALNYEVVDSILKHLDDIESDRDARVVILTGAGERAFSAGADIAEFSDSVTEGVDATLRDFVRRGQRMTKRIESFGKPVIVAVNGLAFGGGCEVTEAAPLAIAVEEALFSKPEIKLGFPPSFGGTQRLPRLVGRKRALRMILTAEPITAQEAKDIGLINLVVRRSELMSAARELAGKIISQPALAVTACLASVTRGLNMTIDEGLEVEATQVGLMVPTSDMREGINAFLERRQAKYIGA